MEITLNNELFEVEIIRKDNKNMYLRVKEKNILVITANNKVSEDKIKNFIISKSKWVMEANERVKKQTKTTSLKSQVSIFGHIKQLEVKLSNTPSLKIENDCVFLYVREYNLAQETFDKLVEKELRKEVEKIQYKFDRIMDDYRLAHPTIHYRKVKSRWGSCIPAKAKIMLNTNLIYYPVECLHYVLLHEYVHMIVPNHSKRFYDIVAYYMPNYKQCQQILRAK